MRGFVTTPTTSGHIFGSLDHYSRDWNLADVDEVNSKPILSLSLPDPRLHEAAPDMVKHKMQMIQHALDEAKRTALVNTLHFFIYIPLVPEIRVE